jgi:hypothetical protein
MIDPFHVKPETVALKGLLTHHYIITIINVFLSNVITLYQEKRLNILID